MKFNIRDILWFTVVAALAVTCCLNRDNRRAVTRNWVAVVNKVSKVRESLDRAKTVQLPARSHFSTDGSLT